MLHFAASRGFAVFDIVIPVNGVVRNLRERSRPAVDAVFNGEQVLVALNFLSLFNAKIPRIAVDDLIILTDQIRCNVNVMDCSVVSDEKENVLSLIEKEIFS